MNRLFWDDHEGCYRDSSDGHHSFGIISQLTNAYLALKGIASENQKQKILSRIFENIAASIEDWQLKYTRSKKADLKKFRSNPEQFILYAQPFFMHYVHRFLASQNRFDIIWRFIQKGWFQMLEMGGTKTLWETWSPKQSECHAWSATPAFDLTTYWAGIYPLTPGFETVEIKPTFDKLDQVDAEFPSCKGNILVHWNKKLIQDDVEINIEIYLPTLIQKGLFIPPLMINQKRLTSIVQISPLLKEFHHGECKIALNSNRNSFKIGYN
jgi:hypothetical protein